MTIKELKEKYYFHDSSIEEITYDVSARKLELSIDFCYWLQDGYIDGDKENGLVKLIFSDVNGYNWKTGEIDSFTILDFIFNDNIVKINVLDAFNNEFHEIQFKCESAEFIES